ncbi:tetratricopeptide repeat protein [Streptomyces sp. NPDC002886]|uniref:tetratricopeptide repeat protein n=1 Tax=Streptomyces sp. NPDC002886 TaxID=3364667 RepID=UPI0036B1C13E
MTDADLGGAEVGVPGGIFHGPTAIQVGDHNTQHVQFVHPGKPAYRIESFPALPRPVRARELIARPSRLLRAGHQVVPFTGRRTDLDALVRWRDDEADQYAIRLVHGPGGQGKTRLAAHFAELSRQAGWTVWQAAVNEAGTTPLTAAPTPEAGTGILLVTDYAERWPSSDLRMLLGEAVRNGSGVPVRVLLLARPAGVWWQSLDTWIGDHLDADSSTHQLLALATDPQARTELFQQARDHFADHLGLPVDQTLHIGPPPDLKTDEDYAQILTIHIAALAAVDACLRYTPSPTDPARASAYLLAREVAYWSELHTAPARKLSTGPVDMRRLMLTATLTRPIARDPHGWNALQRAGLADTDTAANTLLDDHQYCYPPARSHTVLEPLYPDRLGEDLIGLTTPPSPTDPGSTRTAHPIAGAHTDDWALQLPQRLTIGRAGTDAPAPWTRDTLTVLIETARRWPHIGSGQLYPLLTAHPELALHAGSAALAALASLDHVDIGALEAIESRFPTGRHTDLDAGIAAITSHLAHRRLAATQDPLTHARTNHDLAVRLANAGLHDDALAAAQNARKAWQHLAVTAPAHEPDLARSLNNLGMLLSAVGRRPEALAMTEETVEIQRRLAATNAAAHEPDLAVTLTNLGRDLWEVGRRAEGLAMTEEAVEIRRRLAATNAAAHEPDLAVTLNNLGAQLSAVGRRAEGLVITEEVVEVWRRLAATNPAAHDPDLASSLNNLGKQLWEVGRRTEGLAMTEEAVEIRRRLAATNAAAHEPDLAVALNNLGVQLSAVGRRAEGLVITEEAVEVWRRLAAANPAAHEGDLAFTLSNLGNSLSDVGRPVEALAITEEAVEVWRRLAAAYPAAHEPGLARSLNNLGAQLSDGGRPAEGLVITEEAVEVWRRLAAANPAAHEGDLASTLSNLGNSLSDVGRPVEALAITEETVEIRRRLAAAYPAAHEPGLARSLNNLGAQLSRLGRRAEALAVTVETVEIYRRLISVRSNQSIFRLPLLTVLRLQAEVLIGLGRLQDAQTVRDWLAANPDPADSHE